MVLCEKLLHIVAIAQMCEKLDDVLLGLFVVFAFDNEIELVIFTLYYLCACVRTHAGWWRRAGEPMRGIVDLVDQFPLCSLFDSPGVTRV